LTSTSPLPNFDKGTDGLLPVIAQDIFTGDVLMLAWINRESFEQSLKTGYAVYYSRSRKSLWKKGETSGHLQRLREVWIDCDGDAILWKVEQTGAACHEGYYSCFFRKMENEKWIEQKVRLFPPDSHG
jgi:phosphoribosyl-AMP cyclohydrolase